MNVKGDVEDINDAIWKLSESNPEGGIQCTYYDFTTAEAISDVTIKLSRNNKQLLIMSKDVA